MNRYSYAFNNPNSYVDPDGRDPLKALGYVALALGVIAVVVGIAVFFPEAYIFAAPLIGYAANYSIQYLLRQAVSEAYNDYNNYQASAPARAIAAAQKTLTSQVLRQVAGVNGFPELYGSVPMTGLFGGHLVNKILFDDDTVMLDESNQRELQESNIKQAHLNLVREIDSEAEGFDSIYEGGLATTVTCFTRPCLMILCSVRWGQ